MPSARVAAQDGLEVHLLAQPVDAAVGEDRAAQQRLRLLEVEVDAEAPGLDAFVPVAADVGDVAVLLRRDQEAGSSQSARGRAGRCRGASARPSASVAPLQKTALSRSRMATRAPATGAPSSRRVTKTSVFVRAVLHAEAEVRDLHERGRAPGGSSACWARGDAARRPCSAAQTRPRARAEQDGLQVEAEDWMVSGRGREPARRAGLPGGLSAK